MKVPANVPSSNSRKFHRKFRIMKVPMKVPAKLRNLDVSSKSPKLQTWKFQSESSKSEGSKSEGSKTAHKYSNPSNFYWIFQVRESSNESYNSSKFQLKCQYHKSSNSSHFQWKFQVSGKYQSVPMKVPIPQMSNESSNFPGSSSQFQRKFQFLEVPSSNDSSKIKKVPILQITN